MLAGGLDEEGTKVAWLVPWAMQQWGWWHGESYQGVIAERPARDAVADRQGHTAGSCLTNCDKTGIRNPANGV